MPNETPKPAETYTPIPTDRLRELLELEGKATPGEWELRENIPYTHNGIVIFSGRWEDNYTVGRWGNKDYRNDGNNVDLIAESRNSIRSLILEVIESRERADTPDPVRELLKAARAKLKDCREHGECSDAALMEGEVCSTECADLNRAVEAFGNSVVKESLSTDPVRPAAGPIRDELLAALKLHHEWHLEIGTVYELDREGDPIQLDLTDAYSDSGLCESTLNAIARAESQAPRIPFEAEVRNAIESLISDECPPSQLAVYQCEDCGCQFAACVIQGPSNPPHSYISAGAGGPFVAACAVCGGAMVRDIGPSESPAPAQAEGKQL